VDRWNFGQVGWLLALQGSRCKRRVVQKSSTLAVGALLVAAVAVVVWRAAGQNHHENSEISARKVPVPQGSMANNVLPTPSLPSIQPPSLFEPPAWSTALPTTAPKHPRFGIVLIRYLGSQMAPSSALDKVSAFQKAVEIEKIAQKDFAKAVKLGDRGSSVDLGTWDRQVLEPQLEYQLFTLKVGQVKGPLDTPRGYWIVKRVK
jgi:hypothetical protein